MLGRRSHARVSLESGAAGVLSLAADIWVRVSDKGLLIAISRDPAALGERVRVLLADDEVDILAEVVESKPIICDGAVRHRLLMRSLDQERVSLKRLTGQSS